MKKHYLKIGKIVSTFGIKGEVRVVPWSDTPEFVLHFKKLYFDEGKIPIIIECGHVQKNNVILKLAGIDDIDTADSLRSRVLWCDRTDIQLDECTYFIEDIIGITVVDADNSDIVYGKLTEVSQTGANDIYHVEKAGKTVLIPAIKSVIISIDINEDIMKIRPMKGLFDDAD